MNTSYLTDFIYAADLLTMQQLCSADRVGEYALKDTENSNGSNVNDRVNMIS